MDILGNMYNKLFVIKVISSIPGRLRINIPYLKTVCTEWGIEKQQIELILKTIYGVTKVEFNPISENILILYAENIADEKSITEDIKKLVKIIIDNREKFHLEKEKGFSKVLEKIKVIL